MILLMKVMKMILLMKVMKTDFADEDDDVDEDAYPDHGADDDMFAMVPMMIVIIFS